MPDLAALLSGLMSHVWQTTIFVGIVAVLTLAMRNNRASLRHAMWCVASAKFLVPFSWLVAAGAAVEWPSATRTIPVPQLASLVFPEIIPVAAGLEARQSTYPFAGLAALVWLAGFVFVLRGWARSWRQARDTVRAASFPVWERPTFPKGCTEGMRVLFSFEQRTPAVFGLFRPSLVLPEDIEDWLEPDELAAILTHEQAHVERRDNLIAVLHSVVASVFWFHPFTWWIGRQLVRERERACDEAALRKGFSPHTYASGLLKVCRSAFATSSACAAGSSGPDLKQRIEAIMNHRRIVRLPLPMRIVLGVFLVAGVVGPVTYGLGKSVAPGLGPQGGLLAQQAEYLEDWLAEDAAYIITAEEREAFGSLTTEEERFQFIEQFWLRRDPTPETVRNEFQEEHYRRIAYANQLFTSEIAGWRSDRGRVYIGWGAPDEIRLYPNGATDSEDPGRRVFPFERWQYRYLPEVGEDVELEFVDPEGTNEFRLAISPSEFESLMTPPSERD